MGNISQKKIWEEHVENIDANAALNMYNNPAIFQIELAEYINSLCLNPKYEILEAGSEIGVTSFLIKSKNKTLLDLNEKAIYISKQLSVDIGEKDNCTFIIGDMFDTKLKDNSFDIVFNAGVLEHFNEDEITMAMIEYKRICREGGKIIIALPNHHCKVYRFAYLLGITLDRFSIKKWPYPSEHKYYDLNDCIKKSGLRLNRRFTISHSSIFLWWSHPFYTPVRLFFKLIDKVKPFEGYLTVLEIENTKP